MTTAYRIQLRCTDCGHRFRRTVDSVDADDPACPNCAKQPQNIGLDVAAGKAPSIGGNDAVKAMDYTLQAVSEDYGFTDLRTDSHEGEVMTPRLPPAQQIIADGMFNPALRKKAMGRNGSAISNKLGAIAANAMAGGIRCRRTIPLRSCSAASRRAPGSKLTLLPATACHGSKWGFLRVILWEWMALCVTLNSAAISCAFMWTERKSAHSLTWRLIKPGSWSIN